MGKAHLHDTLQVERIGPKRHRTESGNTATPKVGDNQAQAEDLVRRPLFHCAPEMINQPAAGFMFHPVPQRLCSVSVLCYQKTHRSWYPTAGAGIQPRELAEIVGHG